MPALYSRSLAVKQSGRSRTRRNDPTGSGRLVREYETRLVALFQHFHETIVRYIEREHHLEVLEGLARYDGRRDLREVTLPKPILDLAAMAKVLDIMAKSTVVDPGQAIIADGAEQAYDQGTRYAGRTLKRAGISISMRGKGPADWRTLDWLKVRNLEVLKGITAETNKKIILALGEGINQGEGIPDLTRRITDAVDTIGITRARTMARTETMYAVNQGALIRYTQAGVEKVEWLSATEDGRVCEECETLNGQVFNIDSVPEIPVHPNCRCTTAPVVD